MHRKAKNKKKAPQFLSQRAGYLCCLLLPACAVAVGAHKLFTCASLHERSVCVCACARVFVCVFENTIEASLLARRSAAVWPTMGPITSLLIHMGTSLTLLCRESQCNSLSFVSQ